MNALLTNEFIYEKAPFPSCHAATIVETSGGALLAAWFGGTAEGNPDVGIYLSRYEGGHWTPPREVANGVVSPQERHACYNPVLFQAEGGPLFLFYKVGPSPARWWGMATSSTDNGYTWTTPQRLPEGILGPIKNKPIFLPGGDILCPSSSEDDGWRVHFERSRDGGKTWQCTPALNDGVEISAIQPSLLAFPDGRLCAVGRTRQSRLFALDSSDGGHTWGSMRLLNAPNPNSGTDAVTLQDGRFLLVYNPTTKGRTPLTVALSSDAEHWSPVLTLENKEGEYSYPSVTQAKNGLVHVVYTWQRRCIRGNVGVYDTPC